MKKKILISAGGSGGHVIPAMAFYDHLKENFDVFLVLDKRGSSFINEKKYEYKIFQSPRLTLNFLKLPITLINLIISVIRSFFFLRKNKVDILLGTGGYMSVPICLAAKILNIKIYLFEPNMVIGRANKFLVKFCTKLFCYSDKIINFPKEYKGKIFVINHVLRKEIYNFNNFDKEETNNCTNLLIVGGSQGARFFDQNLKNSIINISKKYRLKIYHQISSSDFVDLEFFYKEHGIENVLFNFEDNIFNYINESNLAITRAGASTLSELAFLKVPFVAIPYKFATDNHQLENALDYEKYGCCWILKEEEFSQNKLTTLLLNIIQNKEDYLRKKKSLENFCYQNNWNDINEKLITCLNEN
jgi:UDP-N-acetylglucosamine--N-acetylmuramyl-(pentapeptide) pyrophosphoryl-undecaprenol N-acetylglucosamine transferase